MARPTKKTPCPACGETMKVAPANHAQKVCCPHCRQNVEIAAFPVEMTAAPTVFPALESFTLPSAAAHLADILRQCEVKRSLIESSRADLLALEEQAQSIGQWLRAIENPPDDLRSTHAAIALQMRLFEQLRRIGAGRVALLDMDEANAQSLARFVVRTFAAFGWQMELGHVPCPPHVGEEITLVVAPGPVTRPVADLHLALIRSGVRLHSRIALEQPADHALLCIHRVSSVPRLLPHPGISQGEKSTEPLQKSA